MNTRHSVVDTTLGELTLVAEADRISGLYFRRHRHKPSQVAFGGHVDVDDDALFRVASTQLREYLNGERDRFDLPTLARGDAFQERVWTLVTGIPYGRTTTYGELASHLGDRTLAQRVGEAVGRNPLCLIIPCHRVIGADGNLTGYAGGLERKRALLELEEPASRQAGRLC